MTGCAGISVPVGVFLLTRPSRDVTCGCFIFRFRIIGFLLTRPSRDVTFMLGFLTWARKFLLTRPSRDVTALLLVAAYWTLISTHTPLAGRDYSTAPEKFRDRISTHTPLAGRDPLVRAIPILTEFLLTRPSRDVTTTFGGHAPSRHKICERRTISLEKFL